MRFLSSTSSGLAHLHGQIRGVSCKPSIAHRDLKTKNILVKRDMECCLADFGSSIRDDDDDKSGRVYEPIVGSVRYMAPEILDNQSGRSWSVADFKQADIYSFGLVIWEVLSRVRLNKGEGFGVVEHKPPYYDIVSIDPSIELMREIVCEKKLRPSLVNSLELESCQVKYIYILLFIFNN